MVKSAVNKKREEEKIAAFFKDNAIKRMAEERRQRQEVERKQAEERREREMNQTKFANDIYDVGQRVFHEQMGIGHITDVMNIGDSVMYTIDFGKLGKKAMDASYAKLKKF